ncbi:MAG TPA: NAD(+)/NADH kinase [Anaerolineaceae bacterium]|nr:NAD(+)/NADH kinase [Anaerolineaceae bacterium]
MSNSSPQRIAVMMHASLPEAADEAEQICQFLKLRGRECACASFSDDKFRLRVQSGQFDLVIALGGDGTMLRASRLCAQPGIPILGINLGHFGFLAEAPRTEWPDRLTRLLEGDYRLERRMMLRAEHWRADTMLAHWLLLNEVVVCRGAAVRPIRVSAWVDHEPLTSYVADGLIAASATGSTAYALAAGGPILPPETRNIVIVPVAPHLSMDRAIVLAEGAQVVFRVHGQTPQAVFSGDGQTPIPLQDGDAIHTQADEHTALFVRFQAPGIFYRNLTMYMEQNPTAGIAL